MSDTSTQLGAPAPVADPSTSPPPDAAPQEQTPQTFDADYVSKLRQENARYRQRAQLLEGLDPDSQQAIEALAQGVRAGDPEAVREWVTRQYEAFQAAEAGRPVRGEQGRYDSPRPVAPIGRQQQPADDDDRPLTRAELLKALEDRDRQLTVAQQRQEAAAKLNDEFKALGIDPGSALGAAVARKAMLMKAELGYAPAPAEAHRALMADLQAAGFQPPSATTPAPAQGGVPAAPSGVPGQVDPMAGLTPAQRAQKRMDELARQGLLGG